MRTRRRMLHPCVERLGLRGDRGAVLGSLMLSTGLIAIDATILATAVPSITRDLGGFSQFPWLFSIYLLAQAVSVPIYSKLSDMIGRKPIILVGIGLFLVGSILCGVAWDMPSLIVFRLVQGLGAGAVAPMSMTIVGDVYSVRERAKVQGYLASVWGIASVVGPTLGGLFSQLLSWRWIFLVNIPLCLLAGIALWRTYHEHVERRQHRIDVVGAITLTIGLSAVILGVLEGGTGWAWTSPQSLACFAIGIVALVIFWLSSRRAAEPIVDLSLVTRRVIASTTLVSLMVGAIVTGATSYVPTYLEGSLHVSPIVSGFALASLSIGWPIAATISGRIYLRVGFRTTMLLGASFAVVGSAGLAAIAHVPSVWSVAGVAFVIGFGLGWLASPSLVAAQASVAWHERGVVTGMSMLARSAGSAVGVAILGAIANAVIEQGAGPEDAATIVDASGWVFVGIVVAAVLALVAAWWVPRGDVDSEAFSAAPAAAR